MKFQDNCNIIISGCAMSGKTHFTANVLRHASDMFITPPGKMIYIYSHWQPIYDQLEKECANIEFMKHIPDESDLTAMTDGFKHSLLIADDKLAELNAGKETSALFTRLSHHLGMSTILLLQNATLSGKSSSDITKNCHYNVLMKSGRDRHFVRSLGVAIADYKNLMYAYDDATKKPHSYLVLNTHPKSTSDLRYYSQIFPADEEAIVYLDRRK